MKVTRELVARELRPFVLPAIPLALYALIRVLLLVDPFRRGFLAPGGKLDAPMVVFGIAVIALRLVVIFVVPALVAYRLMRRLNGRV